MHELVSINRKITRVSKAVLPAVSPATFYGRGIFTTLAIYNSKPFQWPRHWQRLTANAKAIDLDLTEFTEEAVENSLSEILIRNNLKNGRARLTFFEGSARSAGIWQTGNKSGTSLLITSGDLRPAPENVRLTISPYKINSKSPLASIKSCNYLENILAFEEAKGRGFDEAICLNEKNKIVSGAMANIFWTRAGKIYTPSLATGALEGTTRDFVLKNFSVREKQASFDELKTADEIFLTSSGIGITRAGRLMDTNLAQTKIYIKIRALFDRFTCELS